MIRTADRFARLDQWVREGHSLILTIESFPLVPAFGEGGYQFINEKMFAGLSFNRTTGEAVDYCGPPATKQVLGPWAELLEYKTTLEASDLQPLFEVHRAKFGPRQLVGGFRMHGAGHVILVPWLKIASIGNEKYIDALIAFADTLKGEKPPLPEWATQLWTKGEESARNTITQLQAQIADLDNQIAGQTQLLIEASELKQLIAGTGDGFKDMVAAALKELGIKVVDGPPGRADLLAFDGKTLAAVEAKGVEGGANETHVGQVVKWLGELRAAVVDPRTEDGADRDLALYAKCILALGIDLKATQPDCIGMLIVGTYRKLPLQDRTELSFPHNVTATISRLRLRALTGLQLLCLLLEGRENEAAKDKAVNSIFAGPGVLEEDPQWQRYLVPHNKLNVQT